MPASTFEDPSRGSKTVMNFPESSTRMGELNCVVTRPWSRYLSDSELVMETGVSSSSEASTAHRPEKRRAFERISLVITSSFFCSSPCTFTEPPPPCKPVMPVIDARSTTDDIVLQADSKTTHENSIGYFISKAIIGITHERT